MIEIRGDMDAPAEEISIKNIEFRATRPTYMEAHGVPSGGDWALQRLGAIYLDGTKGVEISGNLFTKMDSHAVFLSGYNRNTSITRNEFYSLGMSGVALWGRTVNGTNDGRNGDQPRFTLFDGNFCHQIGLFQKQSSCYFQAVSAQNTITRNVCFNLPRAAVNFNDGFGGGNEMAANVLFNTCRESSDHGAFNSWDRLPYITNVGDPNGSTRPAWNNMHHNLIVSNYAADGGCFDNDDGSSYYEMHHNFCVFGGHKGDFDGHSKYSHHTVYIYPVSYFKACFSMDIQNIPPKGYGETYSNNICILQDAGGMYLHFASVELDDPSIDVGIHMGNNSLYVPGGAESATVVGQSSQMSFADWAKAGHDTTTKANGTMPTVEEMMSWGQSILQQ
mmetsp:Transcript_15704/g.18909  ORF Transcript_15704/g.18909 Transcript_15704/m.18909 type:complete len:390 (+) Transcript_15704:2-1171(+)